MRDCEQQSVSGGIGDGFVFLEACPLSRGVVHFKDRVHQHGGAAGAVGFRQHLCVLAQLDLDDVPLLRARVLCKVDRRGAGHYWSCLLCLCLVTLTCLHEHLN